MKISVIMAVSAILLCAEACDKAPQETIISSNGAIKLDKLFVVDGCSVYRFVDAGANRYLTTCQGSVQSVTQCGKGCVERDEIVTAIKPKGSGDE